jgi:hypothetical protein
VQLLGSVTVNPQTPPGLGEDVFGSNATGRKFYVPLGRGNTYKGAAGWSSYEADIEEQSP